MRTIRPQLIAYALLTGLSAMLVALPELAFLIGLLTFGLGLLIPSIWLYVTALMPGLLLHRNGIHWLIAALVSVAAAAALAITPARIAAQHANQTVRELTADDFRGRLPRRPERIELIRDQPVFVSKGDDPIEHAACDQMCQYLLLTRQVTTVTVVAHALFDKPLMVVSYSLAAMARCNQAFDSRNTNILPSTTKAKIAGLCITPARGIGMTDGISISERDLARRWTPTFSLTTVRRAWRIEVSERRQGQNISLMRTTEVEIGTASVPFFIFPFAGFLTTVSGIGISKNYDHVNSQPSLALMDQLGFALVTDGKRQDHMSLNAMISIADRPLQPDRTMVLSILAQPGADRFDSDLQNVVYQWSERFWSGKIKPDDEDRSALSAVALDRRMSRIGGLNVLWSGSPEMVALLAEPILARLAWPVGDPTYDQDRQLAQLVQRQHKDFLSAHSAELLAIVRDHLSRNTSPLLIAVVGLGGDATPALLAGLGSADNMVRIDAINAACRASADAAIILPVIQSMLLKQGPENGNLVIALAALDSIEAAEREIGRLRVQDTKRLSALLRHNTVGGKVSCLESTS